MSAFSKLPLRLPALVLGPAIVLAAVACAAARPVGTGRAAPTAAKLSARSGAALLGPVSASYPSASAGWVLGLRICHRPGCSWLRLRRTTDSGRHWSAVPAPPARYEFQGSPVRAGSVSSIAFANVRDGWAFGPGLWSTHDGGAAWHRVPTGGRAVYSLATSGGRVIAAFSSCDLRQGVCTRFRVYSSPAGTDSWRPVTGAGGPLSDFAATSGAQVVLDGRAGYVTTATNTGSLLLSGPPDGSARWHPLRNPCRRFAAGFTILLAAAGRGHLALACASEPSAGQQFKRTYLSSNGGQSWHRLTDPPSSGYLGEVSLTTAGTILVSGSRSDVYISWDHGQTWHTSPSLNKADAGDGLAATMYTASRGFVLQAGINLRQIWFTRDGGHTWFPVSIR